MSISTDSGRPGPVTHMLVLTGTALVVGSLAALAAIGLVEIVSGLNRLLLVDPQTRVQWEQWPWLVTIATLLVPTLGGLIIGLAHRHLSPEQRPLGPPDVIRSVQLRAPMPDLRSGLVSSMTAALSLGVGASVGQYGPMVYLGAMIGGIARRLTIPVPNLGAIAIGCGVAAAISTAFNAPIAGLVFAHEVVLRHYATQAFAPVTVASATGYVIANLIFDRPALFLIDFPGVGQEYEFVLFAILGLLVALTAFGFMRLLLKTGAVLSKLVVRPELRTATAGLVVGLTALILPDILGIGTAALRFTTIEGAFGGVELVLLIAAKIALTALCVAAGFSGGVFAPALLIGSMMGALFWMLISIEAGVTTSGVAVYAICGMMAFASAVIGAPLACIVIVFELTRNYDVTIAAMVAVVFSNLVSHRVFGRSLFDVQLFLKGIDLSRGRDWARISAKAVVDLVRQDIVTAVLSDPPDQVNQLLLQQDMRQAFVTDSEGKLVGVYNFGTGTEDGTVGSVIREPGLVFDETTSLAEAMAQLREFVGDAVPVIARANGRYIGAVAESDIVSAWLDDTARLRKEENASL